MMKKFFLKSFLRALAAKKKMLPALMLLMLAAVAVCNQSCKAWRTIATSATYVQSNDSTKAQTTTTISTKTTEEYVGTRRK